MISFQCDSCGKTYKVKPEHGGKKTKCKACGSELVIPAKSTRPRPPQIPAQPPRTRPEAQLPRVEEEPQPPVYMPYPAAPPQQFREPPAASVNLSIDQSRPSGVHGFFRAFGITSGFMAAVACVIIGIPVLICSGCVGCVLLFAPSEEEMARIRAEQEARAKVMAEERAEEKAEEEKAEAIRASERAEAERIEAEKPALTKVNYHKVKEGMTYQEVVEIIGPPDSELSSSEIGDIKTQIYMWKSGILANANMTFQNGKLIMKAQFGL